MLSLSVGITALLSLGLRMYIPRVLGVENLGKFHFSEQLTLLLFGFMPFGMTSYIHKYVPPNPVHAKEILFSIISFQTVVSFLIFLFMTISLFFLNKPDDVIVASIFMAGWAYSEVLQNSAAKKMYIALDYMKRISIVNVIQKVFLVVFASLALFMYKNLVSLSIGYFIASILGLILVIYDLYKIGILEFNLNIKLLKNIFRKSIPYFFGMVLVSAFQTTDTLMLSFVSNDKETGYFGAANRLIGIFLILIPAVNSAFVPSLSSDYLKNKERFVSTLKNILYFFMVMSFLSTLFLGLFGFEIISFLYGENFIPSVLILSYLAPVLALTYINTILGTAINISTSGKILSIIMGCILFFNVIFNYLLIPVGLDYFGPGGGGIAVSFTTIVSELLIAFLIVKYFPIKIVDGELLYKFVMVSLPCAAMLGCYSYIDVLPLYARAMIVFLAAPIYLILSRIVSISDLKYIIKSIHSLLFASKG